ncbi:MAG: helix-turn-helix transcriptional regulator [Gemmatimonadales bacterium]
MNLTAVVSAVEVLMSPLEWVSREAWLDESVRRVRDACGAASRDGSADAVGELAGLLRLPDDEPGWLHAALESPDSERWAPTFPATTDGSEALLVVVSLRCALVAGLATLPLELPTTRELRVSFGLRGREPQVALLAAEGLSNAAIAQRLRLSAHTVRHYLERVLGRLGLHTRKALALHLMGGGGERPQQGNRRSH